MLEWRAFMKKYYPTAASPTRQHLRLLGGAHAGAGAQAVRRQPDPRERHEAGREPEELRHRHGLPGIRINTSPKDFAPIEAVQLERFDGKGWVRFGNVISNDAQ
jgi:hypothetical protein